MANTTYLFGVDVGGTTVKIGLFESDGTLLEKWEIVTRKENSGANVLPDIADSVCERIRTHDISFSDIPGIGIGVPGAVTERAVVARLVNVGWGRVDVAADFKKLILDRMNAHHTKEGDAFRVKVANDANVAALGELWKGAGVGCKSLMMVTLGTGIGGGVIIDGRIVEGANGAAGEIGHMHVCDDEREPCTCGNYGCLEQYGSATGVVRLARRRLAELDESGSLVEGESPLMNRTHFTAKDVIDAAKAGDPVAESAMHGMCKYLGEALAHISNVVDPEVFVIGGGVSKAGSILIDLINSYYRPRTFRECRNIPFKIAKLGNDGGIFGAARMVLPA